MTLLLRKGQRYDQDSLRFAGWNDGKDHDGYLCWNYFGDDGEYFGPDDFGVEPTFEDAQCPNN